MESGQKKFVAAKAVATVLADGGFRLTRGGKKASPKTVAAWRDRFIGCARSDPAGWALSFGAGFHGMQGLHVVGKPSSELRRLKVKLAKLAG
jgi:hypothetical protein